MTTDLKCTNRERPKLIIVKQWIELLISVEEEAHCYVVQCRQIVCGQYVADHSTTECRTFRPEGLHQLRTKLRMYSVRLVYIAMGNCV